MEVLLVGRLPYSFFRIILVFQQVQLSMSQPQSTVSKLNSASARLTHRRIFAQQQQPSSGGDLHRIAAKIRQLQDDVRTTLAENAEIEGENTGLIRMLQQLDYVVAEQQERIDELTRCLRTDAEAGECIAQYEQDLGTVAQQIGTLNDLIRTKNAQYEQLRLQREEAAYQGIRLKEHSNHLLYSHNATQQMLHALMDTQEESAEPLTFGQEIDRTAHRLRTHMQELAQRAEKLRSEVESARKEGAQRVLVEKEQRIRLQYQVRLLRERKTDQTKKEGYLRGFYDEARVQEVIDDMLRKEDALRARIAQQEENTRTTVQQWEQMMEQRKRQAGRDLLQLNQQARLIELEIDALNGQLEEDTAQHSQISRRLQSCENDGIEMSRFEEQSEGQVWQRIRATEEENHQLQSQFDQLCSQVSFIQQTLPG